MSWNTIPLGDFLTLKRGYDLPNPKRKEGVVPIVSSSGITGLHNQVKVKGPGVVTGRYGTLGEVFFVQEDFWPLNTSLYVQDFKSNNRRFIAYFLKNILRGTSSDKAAVPGVNRNDLHARKVTVVIDQRTQKRIADILSAYDDLIENNRRRITLLEQAARLLYNEWFVQLRFPGREHVKIIDGVPEGWEKKILSDVCETFGGGTPSTKKSEYWEDGDITWVVPTDITQNGCLALLDSGKKITQAGLQNSSAKMVPPDTILMTSRASVGYFGLIDKEVCTNQGFINIVPFENYTRMYLLHNLMYRVEEIRAHAGGSTYQEISKGRFRAMQVIVPASQLLQEFEETAYSIHRQVRLLHKQIAKLSEARDLLLPRLMNGEITV